MDWRRVRSILEVVQGWGVNLQSSRVRAYDLGVLGFRRTGCRRGGLVVAGQWVVTVAVSAAPSGRMEGWCG